MYKLFDRYDIKRGGPRIYTDFYISMFLVGTLVQFVERTN